MNSIFALFRPRGYYVADLWFKPYFYAISYFNGLLTGYVIEINCWPILRETCIRQIDVVDKVCKWSIIILTVILSLQDVIYGLLPLLSAIEASILPNLVSIPVCIVILKNSPKHSIRRIVTMQIWKELRDCIRVSYPFHVLVFSMISLKFPLNDFHFLPIHLIMTFIINFIFSKFLHEQFEKPIFKYVKILTT